MLALLGLVGIALAGTAIVGLGIEEDEPKDQDTWEEAPETLQEETVAADLLAEIDLIPPVSEVIAGGIVDDIIEGHEGGDYLNGGAGDDTLTGGAGDDQMHGDDGDDEMDGGADDDLVYGYMGDDDLSGGDGADVLHGGSGNDLIDGGYDDDELLGGEGDDTLIGGAGRDNIQGSEGDDVIDGVTGEDSAERDYLNGSEGNDTLIGNDGDVMSGGEGADRFEATSGVVSIMDYEDDDLLVVSYEGDIPDLTTETTTSGLTLLANGTPVANLYGLSTFDVTTVELVSA